MEKNKINDVAIFGATLKKLRNERQMSLRDVEEITGISNAYLSQIEKGRRGIPSVPLLLRLAKAFGISHKNMLSLATSADAILLNNPTKKQASLIAREFLKNFENRPTHVSFIIEKYEALSPEKKNQLKDYLLFLSKKD